MPDDNIFVSSFSLSYIVVVLLPKSIFLFGTCNEVNFFQGCVFKMVAHHTRVKFLREVVYTIMRTGKDYA
jgi:hypothetical protein